MIFMFPLPGAKTTLRTAPRCDGVVSLFLVVMSQSDRLPSESPSTNLSAYQLSRTYVQQNDKLMVLYLKKNIYFI